MDADLLLELLHCHRDRLRAWQPEDALTRQLRLLVEHRRKLVGDGTRLTNRLTGLLKESFPQALEWAGELSRPAACEFLRRWPSLATVQSTRRSQLRPFYLAHFRLGSAELEERLDQIRQAQPLTSAPAVLESCALMIPLLAAQLQALLPALDRREARIAQRYQAAREVQQFSGIAPVTQRSGQSCWVHWRWACPKFLRQSFHEFAAQSIPHSTWATAYYLRQLARGTKHQAAVRVLAYKWIRILYRCWQSRTPYDEQLYLQALARRGSPLHLSLTVLQT